MIEKPNTLKQETVSKVGERLGWLTGRKVRVRLAYGELGQLGSEEFIAVYMDTLPLGREYFFSFKSGGKNRLVRTTSVVEIIEVNAQEE
jgi:hypothetical protein